MKRVINNVAFMSCLLMLEATQVVDLKSKQQQMIMQAARNHVTAVSIKGAGQIVSESLLEAEAPCKACQSLIVSGLDAGFNGCYDLKPGNLSLYMSGNSNQIWCEAQANAMDETPVTNGTGPQYQGRWQMGTNYLTADPKYKYAFMGCCNPPTSRWNDATGTTELFRSIDMLCSASPCRSVASVVGKGL